MLCFYCNIYFRILNFQPQMYISSIRLIFLIVKLCSVINILIKQYQAKTYNERNVL